MSRRRTLAITVASLAAGAVIATGITGIASAAGPAAPAGTGVSAHDGRGPQGARDGSAPGDGMRGPGGRHGAREGSQPLHGETVVKLADGTIVTQRMVAGTVTAVSATSISVQAQDGYTATFAVTDATIVRVGLPDRTQDPSTIPADTIADVSVGDTAHVHGIVTGSSATAERVIALSPEEAAQREADRPGAASGASDTSA